MKIVASDESCRGLVWSVGFHRETVNSKARHDVAYHLARPIFKRVVGLQFRNFSIATQGIGAWLTVKGLFLVLLLVMMAFSWEYAYLGRAFALINTTPTMQSLDLVFYNVLLLLNEVNFTFIQDLSQREPGNNILVGGASILYLLGQLALGAKGKLKTEILNVLNFKNTEQVSVFQHHHHQHPLGMDLLSKSP